VYGVPAFFDKLRKGRYPIQSLLDSTLPRCWGEQGAPLSAFVISSSIVWHTQSAAVSYNNYRIPRFDN